MSWIDNLAKYVHHSKNRIAKVTVFTLFISIFIVISSSNTKVFAFGGSTTSSCSWSASIDSSTGDAIEIFTAISETQTAQCSFTVPEGVYALDYLVVAGGGGGSSGGGGAGGVVTSWATRLTSGGADIQRRNPLFVYPGDEFSGSGFQVGRGGIGGYGGEVAWCPHPLLRAATAGDTSTFGSVVAIGGGQGGGSKDGDIAASTQNPTANGQCVTDHRGPGFPGGSSGGNSYDTNVDPTTSSPSTVIGAKSYGNGGGRSNGSTYNAGGGGGGAGAVGSPNNTTTPLTNGNIGGAGGSGIFSDISGSWIQYGCGGGGGVNANGTTGGSLGNYNDSSLTSANYQAVTSAQAGCSTAGNGSGFGIGPFPPENLSASGIGGCPSGAKAHSCFTGTQTTPGFGGGGGGTDPDSYGAGNGASGVIILRYIVPDVNCGKEPASNLWPIACTTLVHVTAGAAATTVDLRVAPSFSDTPTTTVETVTTVESVTITKSNNILSLSVASATSALIGGTYPLIFKLTTTGVSSPSRAYLLVNVIDPAQHTPSIIPIDPRTTSLDLPPVVVGTVSAVLMCLTEESQTATYPNRARISLRTGNLAAGVTQDVPTVNGFTDGVRLRGTNAGISQNARYFTISKNNGDQFLLRNSLPRKFVINVSNTDSGGNGRCLGGTQTTITVVPTGVSLSHGDDIKVKAGGN